MVCREQVKSWENVCVETTMLKTPMPQSHESDKPFLGEALRDGNASSDPSSQYVKKMSTIAFSPWIVMAWRQLSYRDWPYEDELTLPLSLVSIMTSLPFYLCAIVTQFFGQLYAIALFPCPTVCSKHTEFLGVLWLLLLSPNHFILA